MTTTAATNSAPTSYTYKPTSSLDAQSLTSTKSTDQQDRFLKLLVAQLNNQDPLNPLDNAQMTSQIAQINTVTGIQQLNETVSSLASQFNALQMLQSSSMVGREVLAPGEAMWKDGSTAKGSFDLDSGATAVSVQVLTAAGVPLETKQLGALAAGNHAFSWDASAYPNTSLIYKVTATNNGDTVTSTTYTHDTVTGVGLDGSTLNLSLASGTTTPASKIKAVY